jgi:hypothetical protein
VKAINNIARPEVLIPILLVYRAYPRINNLDLLTPFMSQYIKAIKYAIEEITRIRAK